MGRLSTRIFLGGLAGALSVLVFHQTTLQVFFWLGWAPQAGFRIAQVPPLNTPLMVSTTFWGAFYGAGFGLLLPWFRRRLWIGSALTALFATAATWFFFLPLMGRAAAYGWQPGPMLRSFVAYQMWGIGLALFLPLLHPRPIGCRKSRWNEERGSDNESRVNKERLGEKERLVA